MIFKPKNQVMLFGNVAWTIQNSSKSWCFCIEKYKVHHLERKNSKYTNINWGITVLAAALKIGLSNTAI